MYQIAPLFAAETDLSKEPEISRGSSSVIFTLY